MKPRGPRHLTEQHLRDMLEAICHVRAVGVVFKWKEDFWQAVADRLDLTRAAARQRAQTWGLLSLATKRTYVRPRQTRFPLCTPDSPCRPLTRLRRHPTGAKP